MLPECGAVDTCYRVALGEVCPLLRVLGLQHCNMVIRKQHKTWTCRPRGQKQRCLRVLTFQVSYSANNALCFLPEIDIMNRSPSGSEKLLCH